jgi:hypothetical protein
MHFIQHYFICRPSDSTVSEDAESQPRTVATLALAVRRSKDSARSHPFSARYHFCISSWRFSCGFNIVVLYTELEFLKSLWGLGTEEE